MKVALLALVLCFASCEPLSYIAKPWEIIEFDEKDGSFDLKDGILDGPVADSQWVIDKEGRVIFIGIEHEF